MTLEELARVAASEQESQARFQHRVHVCVAAGCLSSRSNQLKEVLEAEVKQSGSGWTCLV
jgi:bidirectional [NiFe] hydrogenase diaphorase subunit